jgi:aspartate/methionine/tyrosine aminotransferase
VLLADPDAIVVNSFSKCGFYVYPDISHTGLTSWRFCERALQEAHVALTPGRGFGMHTAETHVRLSYATSTDDLHEGIARLKRFMATLR